MSEEKRQLLKEQIIFNQPLDIFNKKVRKMSLEMCKEHHLQKDKICGADGCCHVMCDMCFQAHVNQTQHNTAVCVSYPAKTFFEQWNQYVISELNTMIRVLQQHGFNHVFSVHLGKGSFDDSQVVANAVACLEKEKNILEQNLHFVRTTLSLSRLIVGDFIQDLYFLVLDSAENNVKTFINSLNSIYKTHMFSLHSSIINRITEKKHKILSRYWLRIVKQYKPTLEQKHRRKTSINSNGLKVKNKLKITNCSERKDNSVASDTSSQEQDHSDISFHDHILERLKVIKEQNQQLRTWKESQIQIINSVRQCVRESLPQDKKDFIGESIQQAMNAVLEQNTISNENNQELVKEKASLIGHIKQLLGEIEQLNEKVDDANTREQQQNEQMNKLVFQKDQLYLENTELKQNICDINTQMKKVGLQLKQKNKQIKQLASKNYEKEELIEKQTSLLQRKSQQLLKNQQINKIYINQLEERQKLIISLQEQLKKQNYQIDKQKLMRVELESKIQELQSYKKKVINPEESLLQKIKQLEIKNQELKNRPCSLDEELLGQVVDLDVEIKSLYLQNTSLKKIITQLLAGENFEIQKEYWRKVNRLKYPKQED